MFKFRELTIETAVANQSGAMEADTISKNGASSKSHTSRRNNILVITAFVALMLSMVACGGGSGSGGGSKSSRIPNGTYIYLSEMIIREGGAYRPEYRYTFSGNKYTFEGNRIYAGHKENTSKVEGTYELIEEYRENGFSGGTLILNNREGERKLDYTLEGKVLTIRGTVYTKQ